MVYDFENLFQNFFYRMLWDACSKECFGLVFNNLFSLNKIYQESFSIFLGGNQNPWS